MRSSGSSFERIKTEMSLAVSVLLLGLLFTVYLWIIRRNLVVVWKLRGFWGVLEQPMLNIIAWMLMDPRNILEITPKIRKFIKKRPIGVVIGPKCVVYIDDPVSAEKVLTSPVCYDKTFLQEGFFTRKGLLHARGQNWKNRRKQLNPTFGYSVLVSFFPTFNLIGNSFQMKFAKEMVGVRNFKEVGSIINKAVFVTACQTTMGTETNFLEHDELGITEAYKTMMKISSVKTIKPWLQIDFLWKFHKLYRTDVAYTALVDKFTKEIVKEKLVEWKTQSNDVLSDDDGFDVKKRRNFIEQIFHLAERGEMSLQDIEDESNSMILVAFETVSNSLLLSLFCLAMYPDCQEKLRDEIRTNFPDGDITNISIDDIKNMKYLDMVTNESLRLLPTVPTLLRNVSEDFNLTDDVVLPEGTYVLIDTFNMQRDPAIWGPKAEEFYPEHFLPENAANRHPFAYIPFAKGVRFCIGWRYALFLSKILLTKLIARFHFETDTKLKDLHFINGISLKLENKEGINFRIRNVAEMESSSNNNDLLHDKCD